MGLPVEVNNLMMGSLGGYTVGRSLRFRSSASAYLNRTAGTPTNANIWTWSAWVKKSSLGVLNTLFCGGSTNVNYITFNDTGTTDYFGLTYANTPSQLVNVMTAQTFRDPSAWYHLMVVYDSTSATSTITGSATDRVRLYVNGVQVTAFSATSGPAQNTAVNINSASAVLNIGRRNAATPNGYFDGYLTEVNFIDGQALTPSSFGAYDTNGVWQPKKYTGTYGTNGFYLPFNWSSSTSYAGSFNGSTQYLTVPTSSAFDFGSGDWTIEAWVLTDTTSNRNIVAREYTGNGSGYTGYVFSNTMLVASTSGSAWDVQFTWSAPSANQWHHYAAVRNGNVYSVYIDGIRVGTQTVAGTLINGFGSAFTIGYRNGQSLPSGSISNLRVVKGTAVYTSNFTPPTSALTAISGTSLLTLQSLTIVDNSTNAFTITNVGSVAMAASSPFGASVLADASGNNNGWSGNNINYSAYGTTYDSMIDSPTNAAGTSTGIGNYATFNPLVRFSPNNSSYSSGNLGVQQTGGASGSHACAMATIAMSSGKWYAEFSDDTATYDGNRFGILNINNLGNYTNANPYIGWASDGYVIYKTSTNAVKENNGSSTTIGSNWTAGAIISVAVDIDNSKIWWRVNGGAWFGGGDPAAGTSPVFTIASGNTYAFAVSPYNNNGVTANFGQRPFAYTPPSGFKALNTYNLPAPSIANGAQYMAATTYTGNGSTLAVSNGANNTIGTTFQPDFVWMKSRSNAYNNILQDSVRGAGKNLQSNTTNAETGNSGDLLTSFNSNGFTVNNTYLGGTDPSTDGSGATYVGWQWKAGGTGVTNTSGSITSTVSVSTQSGFSIATYTGTGANATIGHGLGVAPNLIFIKNRSSVSSWLVYSSVIGASNFLVLNATDASAASALPFNNTSPTSSVFSLGTSGGTNVNGSNFVAYCFAAVRGYSAFGSYTGNGSTDGPFVFTNFRPRWIMIKRTDAAGGWLILDTSRDTYNVEVNLLRADTSAAETTAGSVNTDGLSNGFKIRSTNTDMNASGGTYIYACFSEHPFNLSRAR